MCGLSRCECHQQCHCCCGASAFRMRMQRGGLEGLQYYYYSGGPPARMGREVGLRFRLFGTVVIGGGGLWNGPFVGWLAGLTVAGAGITHTAYPCLINTIGRVGVCACVRLCAREEFSAAICQRLLTSMCSLCLTVCCSGGSWWCMLSRALP